MKILGIETSCDETAASVIEGKDENVKVLSNVVSSQIEIHKKYGGVVPEVAAREHVLNILPVVNEALEKAGLKSPLPHLAKGGKKNPSYPSLLKAASIDAIAVTTGPGLVTSLIVGIETARTLAYAWDVPTIVVNHIEGHIYANFIRELKIQNSKLKTQINFPALILTVSGGHNMLVLMKDHLKYNVIGETIDDAAGEAFDKAATMLGIGYPGGPIISKMASKYEKELSQSFKSQIPLPRPMLNSKDFHFSFSGLKTALLYKLKNDKNWKTRIPEYAYEFEQAVVDVLIHKTIKAAEKYKVKTIMLSGGVSANKKLREQMAETIKEKLPGVHYNQPDLKYTTDNAAMIATAGYFRARAKKFTPWQKLRVDPNLELR